MTPTLFITDSDRWDAALRRDPAAAEAFRIFVRTTGIYCRSTCPARPGRENVRFVADNAGALAAGFRACRRRRPDEALA
jgi:AraC family transcriptional regulator of adaptative response/methylated-DNA-[protein]-cysteine methyltransferase